MNDKLTQLNLAIWSVVVTILMLSAAGCGASTGWTVSFGVNPVNYVADQQGLHYQGGAIIPVEDKRRY